MTCSDVERVLPEILEGAPDGGFAAELEKEFEKHVQSCPDCSDLVSDLKLISSEARQLAASDEPSARVWLGIAAQLRAEGLIREPESAREFQPEFARTSSAPRPVLVPASSPRRWSAWWLAPIAAGLVAAGSYVVGHKPTGPVAQQQAPPPAPAPAPTPATVGNPPVIAQTTEAPAMSAVPVPAPAPQPKQKPAASTDQLEAAVEPAPSAEDQQFLSVVSTRAPSMRTAYETQLQAVNADIRETQAYVKQNPGDLDARQHLMDAYQQKALLYEMALDRIQ